MEYLKKKTIQDIDIKDKKVLVRCDFNVPLDDNGNITNHKRITASLETIKYLLSQNAKVILCSHLGRPGGQFNSKFSLRPVARYLSTVVESKVTFSTDVIGTNAHNAVDAMKSGEIVLLENLRFHKEETENDSLFSKQLASLADVYVNDAFGTCHRAHASTVGVTQYLPAVCGFLVKRELSIIGKTLEDPKRPFVAILGGAKVSDKINVIDSLLDRVDTLIIGGGMSYTFMNALGYSVGDSIYESDKVEFAKDMMAKAKSKDVRLLLPLDNKIGKSFEQGTDSQVTDADKIPEGWLGLDIGPKTQELFSETIKDAATIIWNGPLGVFEWDDFAAGTKAIAKSIAESGAISIIGGGDSAAAVEKFGFADKMTHISTGGGATLELLEGKILPGIESLDNK